MPIRVVMFVTEAHEAVLHIRCTADTFFAAVSETWSLW